MDMKALSKLYTVVLKLFMNIDPPGGLVTAQVAGPTASFGRPGVGPKDLHF